MSKEHFTFSTQEAETLGIETAVVLAAAKELSTESMAEQEIVRALQDSLIFLDNTKIAANIHRLIGLKLIKPANSLIQIHHYLISLIEIVLIVTLLP